MITLTPKASAELQRILVSRGKSPTTGLRLAVTKGGCAGWQYQMSISEPQPGDVVVEENAARVLLAADSLERLHGCEVDYSDDLTDAGFKIHNPRAVRSCGCGTSFETGQESSAAPVTQ